MFGQKGISAHILVNLLAGLLLVGSTRAATIWYVDAAATGPTHDGTSWCAAFTDLQDGLAAAGAGDEIRVADGTYTPDRGTGDRTASFVLKNGVTLLGGYAGCGAADPDARDTSLYPSILSGDLSGDDGPEFANYSDNSYHVATYNDPNATGVVLDGFTITAGNANGTGPNNQGGGIHIRKGADKCLPGGPTIRNCIVEKNWSAHHGAVNDHGLSTVIENCMIRENFAGTEGSGLQIHSGAPTVINTVFENNESGGEGGGAWAGTDTDPTCTGPSEPLFRDCRFGGNVATKGGGFFIDGSGPSFESCIFQNNRVFRNPNDAFSGFGGGLYNLAGVGVTLQDCFFTQNVTNLYGGAMYNEASSPVISRCRFFRNQLDTTMVTLAGAILNVKGSSPWIEDCVFEDNGAFYGAAVLNDGNCHATFQRCLFSGNFAPGGPGALFNANGSSPLVVNSVFLGNTGKLGGAIHNASNAGPSIINCLFAGNHSLEGGGAIGAYDATIALLANSTFYRNSADGFGGGLILANGAQAQIHNSIFWENSDSTGTHEASQISDYSAGLTLGHSCVYGWSGAMGGLGNTGSDPRFVNPDGADGVPGTLDDDLRLLPDSPLINAGDNAPLPDDASDLDRDEDYSEQIPFDLDDLPRVVSGVVDMGAYEYADCNDNGIPDSEDIASGTSEDCNENLIPDECEPDCNNNGVADGCELDTDGDGTIDDCDECPNDANKILEGVCGCGTPDTDTDTDGVPDCVDRCPGFDDGSDADGDGVPDGCDQCPGFDDRLDCNSNSTPDACDLAAGTSQDQDGNGIPDECDRAPAIEAEGGRRLLITPPAGSEPLALVLSSPDQKCLLSYVRPDGSLTGTPYFAAPDQWGTVRVRAGEVVPSTPYTVYAEFQTGDPSAGVSATTALWGDTAGQMINGQWQPPDGEIGLADVMAALHVFARAESAPPLAWADIAPEVPDGVVDLRDINGILQAFANLPYPYAVPCE